MQYMHRCNYKICHVFSCYLVKFEKQKNPRWLHFWHLTYFPSTDLDPSTFGQPHTIGVTSSSTDTAKYFNTVQNASLTTSPSSNSSSAFNHSQRSGEVKPSRTEMEGEEEKKGSGEELWRSFIVHHKPGTVCCLEHGQRLKTPWSARKQCPGDRASITVAAPDSTERKDDLEWQSEDINAIYCSMSK